ncbi:small glutamine-rich tetratricopeptide repeat-containing protein alpha-like [Haliotis rubra]|uniref:small glutamine-rich tetratricopeptide repeat-containing protein alpha-like n=1 Tax=Haliotis rubra TaxID=36100 RepID=UPI001EE4F602|nr:small glutamine-rich tetratricopeptide repeat-containing protein alpha-like [Haliotis rubra]
MADVKKLVYSILKFLEDQKTAGSLSDDAVESVEVSIQCLESAYNLNTRSQDMAAKYSVSKNLLDIFNSQLKCEPDSDFASMSLHEPTPQEKEEAERLKNKGNDFMKTEKFSDALECYSKAIKIDCKNAVYFCNRAAAYSKLDKHQLAIEDCNRALNIDPGYSKAYGRLGIAYTALNDHEGARECYRKALELDPDNQSYQNNLEIAETKLKEAAVGSGFGAGPAGGLGMDLGSMLNNPSLVNMAASLMSNPQMQQMMAGMLSGGGAGREPPMGGQGGQAPGPVPGPGSGPGQEQGLSSLLQAGQALASQMQQQNPELVAQLRAQMNQQQQPSQNTYSDPSDPK